MASIAFLMASGGHPALVRCVISWVEQPGHGFEAAQDFGERPLAPTRTCSISVTVTSGFSAISQSFLVHNVWKTSFELHVCQDATFSRAAARRFRVRCGTTPSMRSMTMSCPR